jgi:acetoin utilization deacetylase AcuC-like enzyme
MPSRRRAVRCGLRLYYSDHHGFSLPPGHRFPVAKYGLLRAALAESGGFEIVPAPESAPGDLSLAHDPEYVARFLDGSVDPRIMRRIGFPWSEGLVRRTLASVGGTLAAARDALERGIGGNLAGGTHHASRDEGSGFCVFNDLAVAILALRRDGRIRRAAVIDLDVHQGDGTAGIFAGDPDVLTISIHGANNFPFRKARSTLDIALADGARDDEYLDLVRHVLPSVRDFGPDLVMYQAGVDPLAGDRLGRLEISHSGLAERDFTVLEFTKRCGFPAAITLGGGYAEPVERTVAAHAATFRTAAKVFA